MRGPHDTQMVELDGLVFHLSYDGWKWYADDGARNGRSWYPYMNWTTDECSAPLVRNSPWNFATACKRHDFSWRNLKRITGDFPSEPAVWNGRNKNAADLQFLDDLRERCGEHGWWYRAILLSGRAGLLHDRQPDPAVRVAHAGVRPRVRLVASRAMQAPEPGADRRTAALAGITLGAAAVLYIVAAGLAETCTTDASCTTTACPDRCDRPEQVLLVALPALVVVAVALRRWWAVVVVAAAALVAMAALGT